MLNITLLLAKHWMGDKIKDNGIGTACVHLSHTGRRESVLRFGRDICGKLTNLKIKLRK
jgi:hypothetical protein